MILLVTLLTVSAPDTAVLLAQSCVGEAGFDAVYTGECDAIWHVYRKRTITTGIALYRITRKYSAALRQRRRPWVTELNRDGRKPRHWPRHLRWDPYGERWAATVRRADEFLTGTVADPLPGAVHYGGPMDVGLCRKTWRRITTPGYRNYFYRRYKNGQ